MTINDLLLLTNFLWSPLTFAILVGVAAIFLWLSVAPSKKKRSRDGRLDDYLDEDVIEGMEMEQSFWKRAIRPAIQRVLRFLSSAMPGSRIKRLETSLMYAGDPGGLTGHDFTGIQILGAIGLAAIYLVISRLIGSWQGTFSLTIVRNALLCVVIGYLVPILWLRMQISNRQQRIIRSFSDALDLLSVGVEAGLAFDSAMLRVSENWDNALTREFRRAHLEMRVGTPRNLALQRMATRMGVQDVSTFVGVLIQSSELGVSIAEVLHAQAEEVRIRRRMQAEELARQAGVKMVFALVFLVFPALLVVLLGPGLPQLFESLSALSGG